MDNQETVVCSLSQFNAKILALQSASENQVDEFVRIADLGLRGYDTQDHIQYSISALTDIFRPETNIPTILRDYDSLLGFTNTIPVLGDIYLYTVFNPSLTLTESIHLKVPFVLNRNEVLNHPTLISSPPYRLLNYSLQPHSVRI
jgi:hypothetical protein